MPNLTSVGLTSGLGSSGTGTISTLDNLIGTAGTASAQVQTVQGIASMTPLKVDGSAVTQPVSGTFWQTTQPVSGTVTVNALPAGTNTIGSVKVTDGTNTAAVKAASTAPVASDPAVVVAISPNSVNANGRNTPANSAPVVLAKQTYNTVAASQTAQALTGGSGGATGDWLDFVEVQPTSTSPGVVTILDNTTTVTSFPGGSSSVASLVPFTIPIRAVSVSGAWKITTGANVSAVAVGNFT